jgi:hypothetical protein
MSSQEFQMIMAELKDMRRMIGAEEEWSRAKVREYLGVDNSTLTRWKESGKLVPTKRSTPRDHLYYASQVKSLKKD